MVQARLGPYIKRSLVRLQQLGHAGWPDFASWTDEMPSGKKHTVNVIRHLRRAGYVEDITQRYLEGEPYTGLRQSVFKLTPLGIRALISGNCERG